MRGTWRRLGFEHGFTVLELTMVLAIMGIALPAILLVLSRVQAGVEAQSDRSISNDQVRLAAQQLDREIRSGNLLYDPAEGSPPNATLRIYTQTNATTRLPGNRCVAWRLVDGRLERRDWTTTWRTDGLVSGWRVIADQLVNDELGVPLFRLDTDPEKGYECVEIDPVTGGCTRHVGRTMVVTLVVNRDADSGNPVRVVQSVTGRNTSYGYPTSVCADVPPG